MLSKTSQLHAPTTLISSLKLTDYLFVISVDFSSRIESNLILKRTKKYPYLSISILLTVFLIVFF